MLTENVYMYTRTWKNKENAALHTISFAKISLKQFKKQIPINYNGKKMEFGKPKN